MHDINKCNAKVCVTWLQAHQNYHCKYPRWAFQQNICMHFSVRESYFNKQWRVHQKYSMQRFMFENKCSQRSLDILHFKLRPGDQGTGSPNSWVQNNSLQKLLSFFFFCKILKPSPSLSPSPQFLLRDSILVNRHTTGMRPFSSFLSRKLCANEVPFYTNKPIISLIRSSQWAQAQIQAALMLGHFSFST